MALRNVALNIVVNIRSIDNPSNATVAYMHQIRMLTENNGIERVKLQQDKLDVLSYKCLHSIFCHRCYCLTLSLSYVKTCDNKIYVICRAIERSRSIERCFKLFG